MWQRDDTYIPACDECLGHMPPSLIHEHDGMGTWCQGLGDFADIQGYRNSIEKPPFYTPTALRRLANGNVAG